MKNIRKTLIGAALFLSAQARIVACGCMGTFEGFRPCQAYWRADVVFTGRVSGITPPVPVDPSNPNIVSDNGRVVRFEIGDAFRGVTAGERIELVLSGSSCDYHFEAGKSYFVYAGKNPQSGHIATDNCGRTRPLAEAEDDLAYARELQAGRQGLSIFGVVLRHLRASAKDYARTEGIEGVKVRAVKGDRTFEAVTDAKGRFEFFDLPDGSYRVKAEIPNGLRPAFENPATFFEKEVVAAAPACSGLSFVTTSLGSITGLILGEEGQPAMQMKISLVPLDPKTGEVIATEQPIEAYTDTEGRYLFANLPEGNYAIAVNAQSQPGTYDPPYPRTYVPGVRAVGEAKVFSVADAQFLSAPDLHLPRRLKERLIEGTVQWPDGKPVAGAMLTLVYTERNWLEVRGQTDSAGHFSLKCFEGYKYIVVAEKDEAGPPLPANREQKWFHADPVEVTIKGEIKPIILTMKGAGRANIKFLSEQNKQ